MSEPSLKACKTIGSSMRLEMESFPKMCFSTSEAKSSCGPREATKTSGMLWDTRAWMAPRGTHGCVMHSPCATIMRANMNQFMFTDDGVMFVKHACEHAWPT